MAKLSIHVTLIVFIDNDNINFLLGENIES